MLAKSFQTRWLLVLMLLVNSCTTISDCTDDFLSYVPGMEYFGYNNLTSITIVSNNSTNKGAPFYVLIKPTDFPIYVTEDYEKIKNIVIDGKKDNDDFEVMCILPGIDLVIEIEPPEKRTLGLYFLFTNPGKEWKKFLILEENCHSIQIILSDNQISMVEQ